MNSMDADGEKAGFDLELNRRLATELPVPIIASGGAGTMQDFKDVFDVGVRRRPGRFGLPLRPDRHSLI